MTKQGSYNVNNGSNTKDTSFRSFLCALLVFLALCLILFLVLMFVGRKGVEEEQHVKETDTFKDNDNSKNEKLVIIKPPDETGKQETTTEDHSKEGTRWPVKQESTERTDTPVTLKSRDREELSDTTLGNDILDIEVTKSPKSTERSSERETTFSGEESSDSPTISHDPTTDKSRYEESTTTYQNEITPVIPQVTNQEESTTEDNFVLQYQTTEYGADYGIDHNLFHEGYLTSNTTGNIEEDIPSTTEILGTPTSVETDTSFSGSRYQTLFTGQIGERESTTDTQNEVEETSPSSNAGFNLRSTELDLETTTTENEETSPVEQLFITRLVNNVQGSTSYSGNQYQALFTTSETERTTEDTSSSVTVSNETEQTTDESSALSISTDAGISRLLTKNGVWESTTETEFGNNETLSTAEVDATTEENEETSVAFQFLNARMLNNMQGTTEDATTESETSTTFEILWSTQNTPFGNTDSPLTDLSTTEAQQTGTTSYSNVRFISNSTTEETRTFETTTRLPQLTLKASNVSVPSSHPVCNSTVCKKRASQLLYRMNYDADPCDDFYEFACNGQQIDEGATNRKNLQLLIDYTANINSSSEKYFRDFKTFYESCVKHERNFSYYSRLQFLYDFPNMNLTELFVELILTQSMPLFDIGLDIDKNTQKYVFELTLPGRSSLTNRIKGWSLLGQIRTECLKELRTSTRNGNLTSDNFALSLEICQKLKFRYIAEEFVQEMVREFPRQFQEVYSEITLNGLFALMNRIQDLLPSEYKIKKTQTYREYTYTRIETLNSSTGYELVDWVSIMKQLTFDGILDETHKVHVYFVQYFDPMFQFLSNYTERELTAILNLFSKLQLYANTVVPKQKENRDLYCMDLTMQIMPDTASVISYKIIPKESFRASLNVVTLFDYLKSNFNDSLWNSQMNDDSKDALEEKLNKLSLGMISTGDYKSAIANNRNVNIGRDYQENVVELLRNYRRIIYSLEGRNDSAATLLRYFVDPFYAQPKAFYPSRFIVAHTAFVESQPVELPYYLQLATMGMHLSRELLKHFDPVGKKFLLNNKFSSKSYYDDVIRQTKDLLYHYANYTYIVQGKTVNFNIEDKEDLWVNQMINDNAAFYLVHDLFDNETNHGNLDNLPWIFSDFSINEVFFITAAQEYCKAYTASDFVEDAYVTNELPTPLRLQNLLTNSKGFSDTFNCPDGSPMMIFDEQIVQFPNIDYDSNDYYSLGN